jgi:hypothetical protein
MKTQVERIIEILEREGRIDNFRAIHERISLRLGARIFHLKDLGYKFRVEKDGKNTIYYLVAKPAARQLILV